MSELSRTRLNDDFLPRKKKSPDDEWVEYTDALGRSRKCLKKDLPDLVRNDKELYKYKEEVKIHLSYSRLVSSVKFGILFSLQEARERELEEAKAADLMSEDMRRELLRQKWEKEEEENLQKRNVHYQVRSRCRVRSKLTASVRLKHYNTSSNCILRSVAFLTIFLLVQFLFFGVFELLPYLKILRGEYFWRRTFPTQFWGNFLTT